MAAFKIFNRFAQLLDIQVTRAAAAWLRLNTDGSVSERTAGETLSDLGGMASNPTGITGADAITNIVSLTAAEYAAITPNTTTLYVVT